jgi:hypothetical protein
MSDNKITLDVWVNPLRFLSLEGPPLNPKGTEIDYQGLIDDLCRPNNDRSVESIRERYKRLTNSDASLFLVPVNESILQKLVWPLRSAKQSFCLGNYLGCIALCGTVAEMITIFLFDRAGPTINGAKMDLTIQKKLFGNSFEKLGQERRVEILEAYGILKKELADAADQIRGIRRAYLHILSKEFNGLEKDAETAYKCATKLVTEIVGLTPAESGTVNVPPHLTNYLKGDESQTS